MKLKNSINTTNAHVTLVVSFKCAKSVEMINKEPTALFMQIKYVSVRLFTISPTKRNFRLITKRTSRGFWSDNMQGTKSGIT